jgi:hypothetical protein
MKVYAVKSATSGGRLAVRGKGHFAVFYFLSAVSGLTLVLMRVVSVKALVIVCPVTCYVDRFWGGVSGLVSSCAIWCLADLYFKFYPFPESLVYMVTQ